MSAFVPSQVRAPIGPGTAKTGRPSRAASAAVMSAPDPAGASATTTACASAAITALRFANIQPWAGTTGG